MSVTELLGLLLHLENWNEGKRSVGALGWKIFMGEAVTEMAVVSLEEAIWLIERSGMSQAVYLEARLRLLGRIYFPPVMQVREENKRHRPSLLEYKNGVKAPLLECLSLTLTERLKQIDLSELDTDTVQVKFKVGWGLDGSGEHSNYHQLTKDSYTTKQVMSVCFAVREVTVSDVSGAKVSCSSTESGANKPQNTWPLALFPSKESNEMLAEFVQIVEAEVNEMEAEGVKVEVKGVKSNANKVKYTDEEKEDYKTKRENIKEEIYENLAINIGNPGDMVT